MRENNLFSILWGFQRKTETFTWPADRATNRPIEHPANQREDNFSFKCPGICPTTSPEEGKIKMPLQKIGC